MQQSISVVINTLNEKHNLEKCLKSVRDFASEIVVCDMHSTDGTAEMVKKLGAKLVTHQQLNYVEPARNYAISKASGDYILLLDPDEEISQELGDKLKELVREENPPNFVSIPRKNIIFNKWIQASNWWPDRNIRFFRKGSVVWSDKIHSKPQTEGIGLDLPAEEKLAIVHHHYSSISQFIDRLNRYSNVQAEELFQKGEKFRWVYLLEKPLSEFLTRFFVHQGYKDQLHGLALSLLQAFSFLVVYLKLWEKYHFKEEDLSMSDVKKEIRRSGKEITYWFNYIALSDNQLLRILQKVWNKLAS